MMKLLCSSFTLVEGVVLCAILLLCTSYCYGSVVLDKSLENGEIDLNGLRHLPGFEQGSRAPVLAGLKNFKREKRATRTCSERPSVEVLVYEDLKLPFRCWDDCDCKAGRYCTSPHRWCHDLPKKSN